MGPGPDCICQDDEACEDCTPADRIWVEAQPAPEAWGADATGRAYVYLTVIVFLAGLSIGLAL